VLNVTVVTPVFLAATTAIAFFVWSTSSLQLVNKNRKPIPKMDNDFRISFFIKNSFFVKKNS
jgi:hypothetical protein